MKLTLLESLNEQDIIKAVKERFNASNFSVPGPTYILPDGSFLDITESFDPENSYEDFPCHAEVEAWLVDHDLSLFPYDMTSGSPTLESLGAIRCNDLSDNNFIQLSKIKPTSSQYDSLEDWIYENATHRSELIVATPEFKQYKKYDPEDVDYIIKRIKRYYACGTLYEDVESQDSSDELNIPKYVYHATYPHRWKNIKKLGGLKINPPCRRNWSDSRSVICVSEDPWTAESYAETALDELDKDWDIVILKIDTSSLDKKAFKYDGNILPDENTERTEYEYSKDIPLSCISIFDSSQEEQLTEVKSSNELSIEDLCKQVNHKLNAFGGNCGAFALAMHNKLTPLNYKIEIIFCSDYYQIMNGEEWTEEDEFDYLLEAEPNIYHVAFRVNENKIYDGQGIQQLEDLEEFCYEWYRDPNPCISAFTIDDEDDYRRFEQIIRWNTNLHNSVEDFEEIIDECLNKKSLTESKKKKKKSTNKLKPIFKDHNDLLAWVKKRQKGMSPWGSFNSNAGNVELCNSMFNHAMSSDGESFGGFAGGISNGGLSTGEGIGESLSLNESLEKYYRFEVRDSYGQNRGGIFRGLNNLIQELWDDDSWLYDDLNTPVSKLEYLTPNPTNITDPETKFAYKQSFYNENEELFEDIEYTLNELEWSLVTIELKRPANIVYEDQVQIAFIEK